MQQDPLVENLAQIGSLDQEYLGMLALVENRTQPRDLPADSELKQVKGSLQELRVVQLKERTDFSAKTQLYVYQNQPEVTS